MPGSKTHRHRRRTRIPAEPAESRHDPPVASGEEDLGLQDSAAATNGDPAANSPRPVLFVALACNAAIVVAKFLAAIFSGSAAMAAEGVHSAVDMGNQGLLLYGLKRSRRPPDRHFPVGYGKEVYFWSFVVAIELF